MIGIGWGEMLVIAVVVLIVVGPKDLPVMLRNLGRAMGMVRRMSNEFRRELDKAIAADEVKQLSKSITDPIRETTSDINREFNALRNGKVEPSGKLKPTDPDKESVDAEIRAKAGLEPRRPEAGAPAVPAPDAPRTEAAPASGEGSGKPAAGSDTAAGESKESPPARKARPVKTAAAEKQEAEADEARSQ